MHPRFGTGVAAEVTGQPVAAGLARRLVRTMLATLGGRWATTCSECVDVAEVPGVSDDGAERRRERSTLVDSSDACSRLAGYTRRGP